METRLFIALVLIFLPCLAWLLLKQVHSPWWLENLVSTPLLILFIYTVLLLVLGSFISLQQILSYFVINIVLVVLLNTTVTLNNKACLEPINIFQFNMKYIEQESGLSELIEHLVAERYHLITLQGVSQQTKQKIIERLSPFYPHFIRGESEGLQVNSDQLLFSRYAFHMIKYYNNGSNAFLITSLWQVPEREVQLLSLHPPSPRSESLWQLRNKTLYQLKYALNNSPVKNALVIGDLNLSMHSNRIKTLRQGMDTIFVNSWPNLRYSYNLFGIAIDHLWVSKPARVCYRQRINKFDWSDHYAIKSQIDFK